MKRWVATAAMLLALLGVLAAPAYADPTKSTQHRAVPHHL